MRRRQNIRRFTLAALGIACSTAHLIPASAAVTPGGDTTVAAIASQSTLVGDTGIGSLGIDSGSTLTNYNGLVGNRTGSGTATVSGTGANWTNTSNLAIGVAGTGILSIDAGGRVSSYYSAVAYHGGSRGTATASGVGSIWTSTADLFVGRGGTGTLNIEDGGKVSSWGGYLGYETGSSGTALISGAGSAWTNNTSSSSWLHVGHSGTGTLSIDGAGQVSSNYSYIGYNSNSTGTAIVNGGGSKWTARDLCIGNSGRGTLTITAGGQVSTLYSTNYLGYQMGSSGSATVRGAGSKWISNHALHVGYLGSGSLTAAEGGLVTTGTLYAALADLHGDGTISATEGAVLDADLVFDSSHGTTQALPFGSGGTLNLTFSAYGSLGVGYKGRGSLRIDEGSVIASSFAGYLGYHIGSSGSATVSGAGSKWIISSGTLYVGNSGSGSLVIAEGGVVAAKSVSTNSQSTIRVSVSGNDMLVLGNGSAAGTMTNNGTMALYADVSLPAGTYRPISAYPGQTMTWSGAGSYKAFGGIWSTTAKTFTVTDPTPLSAGAVDTVASGERLLFTELVSDRRVGASFGTVTGSVNFSAMPMGSAGLASLAGVLEPGDAVLGAWDFTTNFSGGEAVLSFDIGANAKNLSIWRLSDGAWSRYNPSLLTYDSSDWASFNVSSFSGYAVAAAQLPRWQGDDPVAPSLWATAGNWSSQVQPGKGGQALFTQSAANKSVDLGGGACTAGLVRLASEEGYSIHNGTLAIDNNGQPGGGIRLEGNGSHTISAAVQIVDDASIEIEGGKLNLSGGVSIISGRTLSVDQAAADALKISAITGGTGTLNLAGGTVTQLLGDSSVDQLAMAATAKLNLTTAKLAVMAGSLAKVNALVASGRAGGSWDGPGIMSSALAGGDSNRTLAVLAEADGVKVVPTWAGDLTGDGVVDGADYLVLDRGFLLEPATLLYAEGNIDYSADGITGDDFFHLDQSYLSQSMASASAAVPEPGMTGLTALLGALLLGRQRSRERVIA